MYRDKLIKNAASKSAAELDKEPISVLSGLSGKNAEQMEEFFGIDTIRKMAGFSYYVTAVEISQHASKLNSFGEGQL